MILRGQVSREDTLYFDEEVTVYNCPRCMNHVMPLNSDQDKIIKEVKRILVMTQMNSHYLQTIVEAIVQLEYPELKYMLNIMLKPDFDTYYELTNKRNDDGRELAWTRAMKQYRQESKKLGLARKEIRKLERRIEELENRSQVSLMDHVGNELFDLNRMDLDQRINMMRN